MRSSDSAPDIAARPVRTAFVVGLMAACAGVVDVWAVSSLGGAFAGVVTGNLVTTGLAVARGPLAALLAPVVAVAGFAVGVAVWSFAWRHRPAAVAGPLLAELVVLAGLAAGWLLTRTRPAEPVALALLGAAAAAMGGQSAVALRLRASTTYMTGTVTTLVAGVAARRAGWAAARPLVALVLGALAGAALLTLARWSVPLLAAALLATALLVWSVPRVPPPHRRHDE